MYDLPPRRRISLILVKLGPAHTHPLNRKVPLMNESRFKGELG